MLLFICFSIVTCAGCKAVGLNTSVVFQRSGPLGVSPCFSLQDQGTLQVSAPIVQVFGNLDLQKGV